jgi:hypothetical protein
MAQALFFNKASYNQVVSGDGDAGISGTFIQADWVLQSERRQPKFIY